MALWSPRRLYAPDCMIAPQARRGEFPGTVEAYRTALKMALPSMSEAFLIALVSIVDTQMVSTIGTAAIAAVALATQPRFLIMTPMLALNIAVTAVVARRKGEQDPDSAGRCLRQAMLLSVCVSAALSAVAYLFREPVLYLMGAEPETIGMAMDYFGIILLGLPVLCLSSTICSAQRGAGQTGISMRVNIAANLVNVVFNYFLINGHWIFPRLETGGAAIATVIGWCVGLVMAVISVLHRDSFVHAVSAEGWVLDKGTATALVKVLPGSLVELLCMRVGMILYSVMVARLGTTMLAANTIGMNMILLSFSIGDGLSVAASALVGQNLGANRPDLATLFGKICHRIGVVCCFAIFLLFVFGGSWLFSLFSEDPAIIEVGKSIMAVASMVTFGHASQFIYLGILRGAGDTKYTAMVSMISIMIVRPLLAWVLIYQAGIGLMGGWLALLVDQYLRLTMTYRRFRGGRWASIKL